MDNSGLSPSAADARSLLKKLMDFDSTLSAAERAIFQSRIESALEAHGDVHAHALERRWESGTYGLYQRWVYLDEKADQTGVSRVDPETWETFAARSTSEHASAPRSEVVEGPA